MHCVELTILGLVGALVGCSNLSNPTEPYDGAAVRVELPDQAVDTASAVLDDLPDTGIPDDLPEPPDTGLADLPDDVPEDPPDDASDQVPDDLPDVVGEAPPIDAPPEDPPLDAISVELPPGIAEVIAEYRGR